MRRLLPLVVVLLATAASAETRWGLTWRAPAECIQAADLARAVEDRLGKSVFGPGPEVRIDGTLAESKETPRWRARLTLVDQQGSVLGSREVTSDDASCRAIDESLTLVVAVMIDPMASLGTPVPPKEEPPPPEEPKEPPLPPAPPPRAPAQVWRGPDPESSHANETVLGFVSSSFSGLMPGLLFAVQTQAGPLRLDVRLPLWPYAPVFADDTSGWLAGVGFGLQLGWLWRPGELSRWSVTAGGGVDLQGFLSSTHGTVARKVDSLGRLDLVARLRVHRRLGPRDAWGIQLGVEAGFAPLFSTLRLVTPTGIPRDTPLGPLHFGLELGFTWPYG